MVVLANGLLYVLGLSLHGRVLLLGQDVPEKRDCEIHKENFMNHWEDGGHKMNHLFT